MSNTSTIDVSQLPESVEDHHSLIWWGNLLLLFIESTMFAILAAGYFYLRMNFEEWPPPRINQFPVLFHPMPDLFLPVANLALILAGCIPMFLADRACLRHHETAVRRWMVVSIAFGLITIWLRFHEFHALHFRWDDNAYSSIVWTILGTHLTHLIAGTSELILLAAWTFCHHLDVKHARDIRVTAAYWYWIAGAWLLLFVIIYLSPRFH
jgi:cytochrome c oxidase subunit 3